MKQPSLALTAVVLLSSIIGGAPRSLAVPDDPASLVNDLGTRALAAMRNGDTAEARQGRFRLLYREYFDTEACPRSLSGPIGKTRRRSSARSSSNVTRIMSSSAILLPLGTSAVRASRCWGASPIRKGSS